jgi:hypothetical protein
LTELILKDFFLSFPCAAVACNASITEVHSSHSRIVIKGYFRLLHDLPSNPTWKNVIMKVTYTINTCFAVKEGKNYNMQDTFVRGFV